jgi:hypothetical protein
VLVAAALCLLLSAFCLRLGSGRRIADFRLPIFGWLAFQSSIVNRQSSIPVIYPYSVIPGGVGSREDLRRAMASDPVVQRAYAQFAVNRCKLVRLRSTEWAYVSYRYGDEVYWTKRKVRLDKGERVISDGEHTARARCGNWISEIPRAPVWAGEPPIRVLETPASPPIADFRLTIADWLTPAPIEPGEGVLLPALAPVPLLPGGCTGDCGAPRPTPVPESSTGTLIGLAIAYWETRLWRERATSR